MRRWRVGTAQDVPSLSSVLLLDALTAAVHAHGDGGQNK